MRFRYFRFIVGAALVVVLLVLSVISVTYIKTTVQAEDIFLPITIGEGDPLVLARSSTRNLAPGDVLTVNCAGTSLSGEQSSPLTVIIRCNGGATPLPTATSVIAPTATLVPPTATVAVPPTATAVVVATATTMPMPAADLYWHAPGAHGDRPAHEHGSQPPAWLTAAGYTPSFEHVGSTPNENMAFFKHTGFKGWAGQFADGQKWYGIFHLDFNPGGHPNRFHSYQLWIQDSSGAVSHMSGWMDFGTGNNTGPQLIVTCNQDNNTRPIMLVNQSGCQVRFENWYGNASSPGPDIGFNINPNYFAGGDPTNPATWTATGGIRNLTRRIEFAWYGTWDGQNRRGSFWTTQWGDVVSGPTAAVCGTQRAVGTKSYTVACIEQIIQPGLQPIQFPGNSVQITAPGGSGANTVVLPN